LQTHPGSRHTQPRPAAPLAIVAVQYRVPMASGASRGWGQTGHATSVSSRSVGAVGLWVSGADVMSVLPSPDGKFVRCGPESRTTRAWPPTCEMLSTPPTLRTADADGRLAETSGRRFAVLGNEPRPWNFAHSSVFPTRRRPLPASHAGTAPLTFVDGVEAAISAAHDYAGDRVIDVAACEIGGQALRLGLIDQVVVSLVTAVLGSGRPFFATVRWPIRSCSNNPSQIAHVVVTTGRPRAHGRRRRARPRRRHLAAAAEGPSPDRRRQLHEG
jgi:hypothetical protein